ncbi:MAG: glycosyltransferase family 2 protein [Xanthobacteraceae bacterium]
MSQAPTWSVMVPVYNRTRYLVEALDSVVSQRVALSSMQIEVVDDCSTEGDVAALIEARYGSRVSYFRQPERRGLAGSWNACIERARGTLIHILHDDDFVAQGYYAEIEALAAEYPGVGLYATRNFFVNSDSIITWVSDRVRELEQPAKMIDPFFYMTPIQCAAVTVRKSAYEVVGCFRLDMGFVTDREMWARLTASHGAVVSPKVLASYRMGDETETRRVLRTAEGIGDICRLNELFAQLYPSFRIQCGRLRVSAMARRQYLDCKRNGDAAAAAANYAMWVKVTPLRQRLEDQTTDWVRKARQFAKRALRLALDRVPHRVRFAALDHICRWSKMANRVRNLAQRAIRQDPSH